MNLPLNVAPTYKLTLPISKQNVVYRPFLVKEEKVLMISLLENNEEHTIHSISSMISACTFDKVKVKDLAIADMEYLFVMIRNKSLGEGLDLQVECPKCNHKSNIQFDMSNVKVEGSLENEATIEISPEIKLTLKYPSITDTVGLSDNLIEKTIQTIAKCIQYVDNKGSLIETKDISEKEMIEFVENMTQEQVKKINVFLDDMPKLVFRDTYKCTKCGETNNISIEGLSNFFD